MAVDLQDVNLIVRQYVDDVKKAMPIDKAILYGSYAKGNFTEYSDVDICFFSSAFENRRSVDIVTDLLGLARKYPDIYIEPNAFPTSEIQNDNPFVKEVLKTGREI